MKQIQEPKLYWEHRARRFGDVGAGLAAVCSYGMPWFYNRYIDAIQWLALNPWLSIAPGTAVLDVGCGIGRWSRQLARRGAHITGIDLSPTMVTEARRRAERDGLNSRCRFLVSDVTELNLGQRFDRVLAVTVLQHILNEHRFRTALDRLTEHLAPRGRMVLLEAAPSRPVSRCDSSIFVAREEAIYHKAFARARLRCLAIRGVDPVPLKTILLPWYTRLPRPLAVTALACVTTVSLPLDAFSARWLVRPSWHKVFILAHDADA